MRPSTFTRSFQALAATAVLAAGLLATPAHAEDAWPTKQITLIVPFAPGGNTDSLGRIIAERLSTSLKQTVVVLNKPGAGSMLGSAMVAHAPPDGYTILVGSIANVTNNFFYKKLQYDVEKDLVAVSQLVNVPNYMAVAPESKFKSVADVIAAAKAAPGKYTCATTGIGTSPYLSCEMFKSMAKVDITNVPYKGGAPAMTDAMSGHADMVFANEALPLISHKQLLGLGVTTAKRSPVAPELPAISETLPGYDITAWYGVFAPAGTPQPIVDKVAREIAAMMKDDALVAKLKVLGATPVGSTPKEFAALIHSEMAKWSAVIKPMNITLDE